MCQTNLTSKLFYFCQEYPLENAAVFTLDQTQVDYGVTCKENLIKGLFAKVWVKLR